MAGQLVHHRSYLADNRRLIIGRALASAAAGALPIPLLEDWLASRVSRGTIRRIADRHAVDLDEEAVRAIADGPVRPPEWTEVAGGAIAYRLVRRSLRRFILVLLAARRAQAASRHFVVGTLFDHYCARLHVGMGLDGPRAAELRAVMDQAIGRTPGGLGRRVFRRGLVKTARASVRTPLRLVDAASGGMLKRLLTRRDEVEAVAELDKTLDRQLGSDKSFLARSAVAVESELAAEGNPYLESLLDSFDQLWRSRSDASK